MGWGGKEVKARVRQAAKLTEMISSTSQGCSSPGLSTPVTYRYVPEALSLRSSLSPLNTAGPSSLGQPTDRAVGAGEWAGKPTCHHMPPRGMALLGSGWIMDGAELEASFPFWNGL